ncbi:MAG: zf-HC2 domain-containing protein [Spirochaetaceae bacterium]|jgi:hypothetical protein|nr:zf-HC2 domain-containing protein [Spirochaetaceae bacterium]
MCPDRQILSVYFDGELPNPWKEKLETHIETCPECRARLDRYRYLVRSLGETGEQSGALPTDAVRERIWENLTRRASASIPPRALWRRSVSIPLPVAAAAAAILVLAFTMIIRGRPWPVQTPDMMMGSIGLDLQGIAAQNINDVLRYLSDEDNADIVIIRLPESKSFQSLGEPTIMKAADYVRRTPSR